VGGAGRVKKNDRIKIKESKGKTKSKKEQAKKTANEII
jgi:hypothetical protein